MGLKILYIFLEIFVIIKLYSFLLLNLQEVVHNYLEIDAIEGVNILDCLTIENKIYNFWKEHTSFPRYLRGLRSRKMWTLEYQNRHSRLKFIKFPSLFAVFPCFLIRN